MQVNELTFVIKSDLSQLNQSIAALQQMSQRMHPGKNKADQEGEHNRNVLLLLQGRLSSVGENFRDILEASRVGLYEGGGSGADRLIGPDEEHASLASADGSVHVRAHQDRAAEPELTAAQKCRFTRRRASDAKIRVTTLWDAEPRHPFSRFTLPQPRGRPAITGHGGGTAAEHIHSVGHTRLGGFGQQR